MLITRTQKRIREEVWNDGEALRNRHIQTVLITKYWFLFIPIVTIKEVVADNL